jgi:UDP-GlcNAc3NAcA epimerase
MKLLSVIGCRPQIIKLSAIQHYVSQFSCKHIVVHTGQHYDFNMSGNFLRDLDINIDYNLGIGGISNCKQTGYMMAELENVFYKERPSMVLVYGDTNSTLAGALASKKCQLPLAHIEAGCRSYTNIQEEYNRLVTDHLSDLLFCTDTKCVDNLTYEGLYKGVHVVGDVMTEMTLRYADTPCDIITKLMLKPKHYFLCTVHRAENLTQEYLMNILAGLSSLKRRVVLVCHPRTAKLVNGSFSNVTVMPPISYFEMLNLEKNCELILTDSGGVQREASLLNKPCVILRDETEWRTLDYPLAGNDPEKILKSVELALSQELGQKKIIITDAGKRIMEILNGSHGK